MNLNSPPSASVMMTDNVIFISSESIITLAQKFFWWLQSGLTSLVHTSFHSICFNCLDVMRHWILDSTHMFYMCKVCLVQNLLCLTTLVVYGECHLFNFYFITVRHCQLFGELKRTVASVPLSVHKNKFSSTECPFSREYKQAAPTICFQRQCLAILRSPICTFLCKIIFYQCFFFTVKWFFLFKIFVHGDSVSLFHSWPSLFQYQDIKISIRSIWTMSALTSIYIRTDLTTVPNTKFESQS